MHMGVGVEAVFELVEGVLSKGRGRLSWLVFPNSKQKGDRGTVPSGL